jgi:hypothetical protein
MDDVREYCRTVAAAIEGLGRGRVAGMKVHTSNLQRSIVDAWLKTAGGDVARRFPVT